MTNTGDLPGEEVAQLYIHQRYGSSSRPMRELKGFQWVFLNPRERRTLTFVIGAKELTYWCSSANTYVQDETTIDLWTGSNLDAKLHTVFEVRGKSTRGIVEQ